MKMMFAHAATFVLSTAGALAILVGVIDQPQVAAVMSPVVSPLA